MDKYLSLVLRGHAEPPLRLRSQDPTRQDARRLEGRWGRLEKHEAMPVGSRCHESEEQESHLGTASARHLDFREMSEQLGVAKMECHARAP